MLLKVVALGFLAFLYLCPDIDAGHEVIPSYLNPSIYPVVWSKTKLHTKTGLRYLTIDIDRFFPCDEVAEMLRGKVSKKLVETFDERCNKRYAHVEMLINQQCRYVDSVTIYHEQLKVGKRVKRSWPDFVNAIHSGTSLVVMVVKQAVKVFREIKQFFQKSIKNASASPTNVEIIESNCTDNLAELESKFNATLAQYDEKVQSELSQIHVKFDEQSKFQHFESFAITKIFEIERLLARFLPKFNQGKFLADELELLISEKYNLSDVCQNCSDVDTWQPVVCERTAAGNLVLKLLADVIDEERVIVQANAFKWVKRDDDRVCFMHYNGPQLVHYDLGNDCASEVHESGIGKTSIFMPKFYNCTHLSDNKLHYWTEKNCVNASQLSDDEVVQVKSDGHSNCIYCYGLTISIPAYHERFTCDNVIYRIDKTKEVYLEKAGGIRVKLSEQRERDSKEFISPDLGELISTRFGVPSIGKLEKSQKSSLTSESSLLIWSVACTSILFGLLFAGLALVACYKLTVNRNQSKAKLYQPDQSDAKMSVNSISMQNPVYDFD